MMVYSVVLPITASFHSSKYIIKTPSSWRERSPGCAGAQGDQDICEGLEV
jgi:hypothetical protein